MVNCTGLSSRTLGGVEDKTLYPARGQLVVVRNTVGAMSSISGCDDGEDETSYTMMRADGAYMSLVTVIDILLWPRYKTRSTKLLTLL